MTRAAREFVSLLKARQQFHQCTDEGGLANAFSAGIVPGYIGYDCTAPSLHVGNLVTMMMLRRLQQCGGKPIVIVGGGTTKVGDPSGKDETRQLLDDAKIAANMASIKRSFEGVLRFGDGPSDAIMVNNSEWLDALEYIPFLRDVGRHFTINRMLAFDSVKLRLEREQPLTFLEFNYMILQAYDFLELNKRYGCILQMGGSDQWGNIVNGIELTRRKTGAQLYGVTCPLLTTSSGAKMGKSVTGAVWLNADMLPDFDFWQYWRNCEDGDVGTFLRIFTEVDEAEIGRLEALKNAELNDAKNVLATEVTALVRGRQAAERASSAAQAAFGGDGSVQGLPTIFIPHAEISAGIGVLTLFTRVGMTVSNSEARKQVQNGGLKVNDRIVTDIAEAIGLEHLVFEGGAAKLSLGKKRHVLIRSQ
jgi:tyrosyl-tRNA synthetase